MAKGWITKDPFYGIKFKEQDVIKETLAIQKVMKIYGKDFEVPKLNRTHDIFVFCYFTGLTFIDVSKLKAEASLSYVRFMIQMKK